jgi:hypothetical protein
MSSAPNKAHGATILFSFAHFVSKGILLRVPSSASPYLVCHYEMRIANRRSIGLSK